MGPQVATFMLLKNWNNNSSYHRGLFWKFSEGMCVLSQHVAHRKHAVNISRYHCYYVSSKACFSIPFFEEVVTPFWVPTTACLHGMGQAAHTVQWLADSASDFSLSWGLHKARPLVDTLEEG